MSDGTDKSILETNKTSKIQSTNSPTSRSSTVKINNSFNFLNFPIFTSQFHRFPPQKAPLVIVPSHRNQLPDDARTKDENGNLQTKEIETAKHEKIASRFWFAKWWRRWNINNNLKDFVWLFVLPVKASVGKIYMLQKINRMWMGKRMSLTWRNLRIRWK